MLGFDTGLTWDKERTTLETTLGWNEAGDYVGLELSKPLDTLYICQHCGQPRLGKDFSNI